MKKIAIGGLLLMSACTTPSPLNGIPEAGGGGSCNAARAQSLLGRTATTELGGEALRLTGASGLRWIPPNSAVTMDYSPGRLNIELDAQNRVTRIRCG